MEARGTDVLTDLMREYLEKKANRDPELFPSRLNL